MIGGEDRIDYVRMRGNDGRSHDVPVHWVEYIPVDRTSDILVCDTDPEIAPADGTSPSPETPAFNWQERFAQHGVTPENAVARRSLFAAFIR